MGHISTLALLVIVAALEEVLFRGVLVDLCLALDQSWLTAACLAGTVIVFAASHVYWGWSQVFAKGLLGVFALISVLSLGTVVAAVVAHVLFNGHVWLVSRAEAPDSRGEQTAAIPAGTPSIAEVR
jgi:membrane protease YdiL (CAAX protease family)